LFLDAPFIAAGVPRKSRKHPPGHPKTSHGIRPATLYCVAHNLARERWLTCDSHHQVGGYSGISPARPVILCRIGDFDDCPSIFMLDSRISEEI
jgi:hypothetical protein